MKPIYPAAVTWFMVATLSIAFVVLIVASPVPRKGDILFWILCLNALGLLCLSVVLHHEPREEERDRVIRFFFLLDWLLGVGMAIYAVWRGFPTY